MTSKTVIVDEVPLFRDGIRSALSTARSLIVIEEGATLADARRICEARRPDVLIIGSVSGDGAVPVIAEIVRRVPAIAVICLTTAGSEDFIPQLLRAGARGCVSKMTRSAELMRCLDVALGGANYVSPSLAALVLSHAQKKEVSVKMTRRAVLTDRETEILELVAEGRSNKEIAEQLKLSEKTVKRYMTFIMQKINVRNRLQAALYLSGETRA